MDLGPRQRENLAKALYDVGKLVLALVVLGPFASPTGVAVKTIAVGLVIAFLVFSSAIIVDMGGKQK